MAAMTRTMKAAMRVAWLTMCMVLQTALLDTRAAPRVAMTIERAMLMTTKPTMRLKRMIMAAMTAAFALHRRDELRMLALRRIQRLACQRGRLYLSQRFLLLLAPPLRQARL